LRLRQNLIIVLLLTHQSRHLSHTPAHTHTHIHSVVIDVTVTCFLAKQCWASVGQESCRAGHTNSAPKYIRITVSKHYRHYNYTNGAHLVYTKEWYGT